MTNREFPKLIIGNIHQDRRGILVFNNEFDLSPIKRMYIIKHPDDSVIRAWQGHLKEHKYFMCIKGKFVIVWKDISNYPNINDKDLTDYKILRKDDQLVLSIPPGFANGMKALENNSELLVFSNFTLNESGTDNFRFDKDLWFDWDKF
ncbi:WxcM-like domain-containing protein [Fidelibacter multiformis]|uniref:WxcM-like domain-containing protein n=1 Tax=Fidelibacter multiformis TaxID=3377529 RepID=UPI0037DC0E60